MKLTAKTIQSIYVLSIYVALVIFLDTYTSVSVKDLIAVLPYSLHCACGACGACGAKDMQI